MRRSRFPHWRDTTREALGLILLKNRVARDGPPRSNCLALLVDARRRAGLTQEEVARRAGVARPSISQYENGKKDPSVTNLNRLIQACGMELHLRAEHLSEADRAQAFRDAAVGPAEALRNAQRARAGLVQIRRLTPAEKAGSNSLTPDASA